jgi:hypothetical protein
MKNKLRKPPMRKVKSPILENAKEPGGPQTPGAKKKRAAKKTMTGPHKTADKKERRKTSLY